MTTTGQRAEAVAVAKPTARIQGEISTVRSVVAELEQTTRGLIRQRPVVAVLVSAGVGYLVARAFARVTR